MAVVGAGAAVSAPTPASRRLQEDRVELLALELQEVKAQMGREIESLKSRLRDANERGARQRQIHDKETTKIAKELERARVRNEDARADFEKAYTMREEEFHARLRQLETDHAQALEEAVGEANRRVNAAKIAHQEALSQCRSDWERQLRLKDQQVEELDGRLGGLEAALGKVEDEREHLRVRLQGSDSTARSLREEIKTVWKTKVQGLEDQAAQLRRQIETEKNRHQEELATRETEWSKKIHEYRTSKTMVIDALQEKVQHSMQKKDHVITGLRDELEHLRKKLEQTESVLRDEATAIGLLAS